MSVFINLVTFKFHVLCGQLQKISVEPERNTTLHNVDIKIDTQSCSKCSSPSLYSSLSAVTCKNLLTLFVCLMGSKNLMICCCFLGDELTLDGIGLADGADIFVWNGKEVKHFLPCQL